VRKSIIDGDRNNELPAGQASRMVTLRMIYMLREIIAGAAASVARLIAVGCR
jgi:hypothetical protein